MVNEIHHTRPYMVGAGGVMYFVVADACRAVYISLSRTGYAECAEGAVRV